MRMILPPIRERRAVDRLLSAFFHDYKAIDFKKAIAALCRFYNLKNPQVEWFEYIDWGKTAGKTYENGQIYLVHPENWKKGRKYNTERRRKLRKQRWPMVASQSEVQKAVRGKTLTTPQPILNPSQVLR